MKTCIAARVRLVYLKGQVGGGGGRGGGGGGGGGGGARGGLASLLLCGIKLAVLSSVYDRCSKSIAPRQLCVCRHDDFLSEVQHFEHEACDSIFTRVFFSMTE